MNRNRSNSWDLKLKRLTLWLIAIVVIAAAVSYLLVRLTEELKLQSAKAATFTSAAVTKSCTDLTKGNTIRYACNFSVVPFVHIVATSSKPVRNRFVMDLSCDDGYAEKRALWVSKTRYVVHIISKGLLIGCRLAVSFSRTSKYVAISLRVRTT